MTQETDVTMRTRDGGWFLYVVWKCVDMGICFENIIPLEEENKDMLESNTKRPIVFLHIVFGKYIL